MGSCKSSSTKGKFITLREFQELIEQENVVQIYKLVEAYKLWKQNQDDLEYMFYDRSSISLSPRPRKKFEEEHPLIQYCSTSTIQLCVSRCKNEQLKTLLRACMRTHPQMHVFTSPEFQRCQTLSELTFARKVHSPRFLDSSTLEKCTFLDRDTFELSPKRKPLHVEFLGKKRFLSKVSPVDI